MSLDLEEALREHGSSHQGGFMKLVLAAVLTIFTAGAFAAGDSGCGLGSMVISKNSKGLQLLSLTTNASFFSQGFGITSGTSGCSSSGIVQNDRQIEYFVEVNHDDLTREMAQGDGEKLKTLAALNGCMTTQSQRIFGQFTQKSYGKIIPAANTGATQMVSNLRNEMQQSKEIADACEMAKVSSL
jgi:hypothetical protein